MWPWTTDDSGKKRLSNQICTIVQYLLEICFLNKFNSYWSVNSVNRQEAKKKKFSVFFHFCPTGGRSSVQVLVGLSLHYLHMEVFMFGCHSGSWSHVTKNWIASLSKSVSFWKWPHAATYCHIHGLFYCKKFGFVVNFLFSSLLSVVRSCACGWGWKWQFWTSCFQAGVLNDRLTLKELSPKLSCLTGGDGSSGEKG